jgi:hypothetical protein
LFEVNGVLKIGTPHSPDHNIEPALLSLKVIVVPSLDSAFRRSALRNWRWFREGEERVKPIFVPKSLAPSIPFIYSVSPS